LLIFVFERRLYTSSVFEISPFSFPDNIKAISDNNGYMHSLGATQTALVKREAAEGEAKNQSEAAQKVAQAESGRILVLSCIVSFLRYTL
jgi:hypothetical protein